MPTGACGIDCDVCHLNLKGICSSCGPGAGDQAVRKLAAQQRILGGLCPVLACARMNNIDYCLRDCHAFPCDNFRGGPYPFSRSYLAMHDRRKVEQPKAYAPDGSHLEVDQVYWREAAQRDATDLCNLTFFEPVAANTFQFPFLNETIRIDLARHCLMRELGNGWQTSEDPLLTLVTVMYLRNIDSIYPMDRDIVGVKDLRESHFFTGPHEFRTQPLLRRFENDPDGFCKACDRLEGKPVEMADAAYRLLPFPRVPLYFLLWQGDDEFKPRLQVLFDRSIESFLAADAIWALVNRVTAAIFGVL